MTDLVAERERLLRQLGPLPPAIESALRRVPREAFVPDRYRRAAYWDEPLPLPHGSATVSAPHMVALQLEALAPAPGNRILEVGAGYGYLAALLADLVGSDGRVLALELEPMLAREAARRLEKNGFRNVEVRAADGARGAADVAPFDRIVVSCAAREIASPWIDQLSDGGTLVVPVGDEWEQRLTRVEKHGLRLTETLGVPCRFVPMRIDSATDL